MSHSTSSGGSPEILHQGWLTKSPPSKGIFKPRWRRRWFILRAGSYPNQYLLEYFTDQTCRRLKGKINLDECEQLDLASNVEASMPLATQERHKYTFNLQTPQRTYYLAADSEPDMSKWITCLCRICGLKTTEQENGVQKPDENNLPPETEDSHDNLESDESSPTLSSVSGPYIPISECFSGKPIKFSEKESAYCNARVFAFPPKVNWSTYPRKGSLSSKVTTATSTVPPIAPPRPPKTIPGISVTSSNSLGGNVKQPLTPYDTRPVFTYDNLDENDSSSTSSSLQSPAVPALYSNLGDLSTPGSLQTPGYSSLNSEGCSSSAPSPADQNVVCPPKVNRNLKPDLNKTCDASGISSQQSPTSKSPFETAERKQASFDWPCGSQSSRSRNGSTDLSSLNYRNGGAMTLPSRHNHRSPGSHAAGPAIDRSRKPPDSPITLGPTPAQIKSQNDKMLRTTKVSNGSSKNSTSTLPSHSSGRRLVGPILSPSDKKPIVFHEYEQPPELIGAYLQIDTKSLSASGSDGKIHNTFKTSHKKLNGLHSDQDASVEYRLIDPIKTKALNQMIHEREEQLRTVPVSKNLS